jgi:hypothetical protein
MGKTTIALLLLAVTGLSAGAGEDDELPTVCLVVQVVDDKTAEPIPGARARVYRDATCGERLGEATADADGICRIEGMTPGAGVALRVDEPGRRFALETFVVPCAPRTSRVSMGSPIRLRGVVLDAATDRPIEGATVIAQAGTLEPGWRRTDVVHGPIRATASTERRGRFTLPDAGRLVRIRAEGYAASLFYVQGRWRDLSDLRFRLIPSGVVRGRVLDPEGRPVVGARVLASAGRGEHTIAGSTRSLLPDIDEGSIVDLPTVPWARTDESGEYSLELSCGTRFYVRSDDGRQVMSASWPVWVRPGSIVRLDLGYAPRRPAVRLPPPLPPRSERVNTWRPTGTFTLRGRVLDENGNPVPGAVIVMWHPSYDEVRAREDGRFLLIIPRPGKARFGIAAPGFTQETVKLEDDVTEADFRIERLVRLEIPLVLPSGHAAPPDVRVAALPGERGDRSESLEWPADGTLRLDLDPETRKVWIRAPGFLPVAVSIEARPGEIRSSEPIELDRGSTLGLRVIDDRGRSVPGAEILAGQPQGPVQSAVTDAAGRATLSGLLPGLRTTVIVHAA